MELYIYDEIYPGFPNEFLLDPIVFETILCYFDFDNWDALFVLLAELCLVFGLRDELTEYCCWLDALIMADWDWSCLIRFPTN